MAQQQFDNPEQQQFNVVVINAHDNPMAVIDEAAFKGNWHWFKVPESWKPGEPLPTGEEKVDAMIVFATKYREDEIRALCENIRQVQQLNDIPLLVAVNQYQMPLANRVREMPNTDFIVAPIEEEALVKNLNRAVNSQE